jgi:hypothetical protein
LKDFEEG